MSGPLVARPRLLARLDQGLQRPLTLLSAPAGFGKTTLLAQWAETHDVPAASLRAGEADRALAHFVSHLLVALHRVDAGFSPHATQAAVAAGAAPGTTGEALAEDIAATAREIVLIIDDYHLAASTEVEHFLSGLLLAAPPALHLIVATRSDPMMSLARLRLQGSLAEVRAADLRFTSGEIAALLAASGHGEDPGRVSALQSHTEGWVAGLRMALLAFDSDPSPCAEGRAAATDQHLMDFLLEEVLARQPAETQEVLLRLAVVDRSTPSLAQALLGGGLGEAEETLARAQQRGLFLEMDGEGERYRFHPLFRRLLRHQADLRLGPDAVAALHLRASAWFADHDLPEEAIQHRVAAGDLDGAAQVLAGQVDAMLAREDWATLSRWLQLLPAAHIARSPRLLLARAWVGHLSGRMMPIRDTIVAINALLAGRTDEEALALQRECDVVTLASMTPLEADPSAAVSLAHRILEHLPDERRLPIGLAVFTLGCALHASGRTPDAIAWLTAAASREEERIDAASLRALIALFYIHRQTGNLTAAATVARHALALAEREGLAISRGWAHWALGWIAYERDALPDAHRHFTAIDRDRSRVHLTCVCEALMGLALIAQAEGNAAAALEIVLRIQEQILAANALEYLPWLRAFEADLAVRRGQIDQAVAWLHSTSARIDDSTLHITVHSFLIRIRVLLAQGSPASVGQAQQDLAALQETATALGATAFLIRAGTLQALAYEAQGEHAAALAALAGAVELGAPGGYRRPFLDLGPALAPLLGAVAGRDAAGEAAPRPAPPSKPVAPGIEVLTEREADVLNALARRLTYREIAAELFVSIETVKTHASHIYAKLGVAGRREALLRARALGWIGEEPPR